MDPASRQDFHHSLQLDYDTCQQNSDIPTPKKERRGIYHYFSRVFLLILSPSRVISWSNSGSTSHCWGFNSCKSWPTSTPAQLWSPLRTCTHPAKKRGGSWFGRLGFTGWQGGRVELNWHFLDLLADPLSPGDHIRDGLSRPYQWFLVDGTKSKMAGWEIPDQNVGFNGIIMEKRGILLLPCLSTGR